MQNSYRHILSGLVVTACLFISGCDKIDSLLGDDKKQETNTKATTVPKVGFIKTKVQSLEIKENLPGRLESFREATIRARVTGIVLRRMFTQGAYVKEGDLLFQIDDQPFRAKLASAKAQLKLFEASKMLYESEVDRYTRLVKSNAIPRQTLNNSMAALESAIANIEIAKASIVEAQIQVGYARVTAPISGYIGSALVTEGALVSAAEATQMANIQQIDQLYINIKQTGNYILKLKQRLLEQKKSQAGAQKTEIQSAEVDVTLDDGTAYPEPARLIFTGVSVDPATGEASLRALLPNPENLLMAGLYVRVNVPQATIDKAVLVPQQAVSRGTTDTVYVVNDDNTFAKRSVKVEMSYQNNWVITDGLKTGEKVIVDGFARLRGAKKVSPVMWGKDQKANSQEKPMNDK